ncbi:tRNA 2-selenouridine(34) synthase MnmH [Puteibacter caeruleilacunae]|nr:tRNA 2-selenouridine(34) synthase MnmH [Puteibacter caeruleilacunae]
MSFLSVEQFIKEAPKGTILDIRSPKEYEQGHIPGAQSFPLFTNDERAEVGTLYKKKGKDQAVIRGLQFVGPKMADFVIAAKKIGGPLYLHCWRGGMRSSSMAWLLQSAGLEVYVLKGGYKAWRNHHRELIKENLKLLILGGPTGSGKTDILDELEKQGEQVIDLEGLAHHKGSSFGALGQTPQPTTEQFENDIFDKVAKTNFSRPVWVEGESRSIGHVFIPTEFDDLMRVSPLIVFTIPQELRIERLVRDYACFPTEKLHDAVDRIKKRLGGLQTQQAFEALDNKDFHQVAKITLSYYDKAYYHAFTKRNSEVTEVNVDEDDPVKTATKLIQQFSSISV